jgi:DNA-binding transcriptional regulator LsrR (DeoR family)
MSSRLDVQLIVKVAQMYYLDGLKQEDIARQIGISRSLISMILTEAKERGIVEITVRDPFLNDEELSSRLASHYPRTAFTVIPTSSRDATARRKLVAQRAADILARSLKGDEVLGLAWGRTCLELVHAFRPADEKLNLSIVPLIGGTSQTAPYFQINEMVRVLAERAGGIPYFIHAPALVSDRGERDLHLNGSAMQPIRQRWKRMDVLVTAIGALGNEHPDRESYLGETEVQRDVGQRDAAGDICARYFDHRGRFIVDDHYERVVGVPVEDLKAARTAVCMASGVEKADAIVGALKTGVAKQLVMDEPTARAALEIMVARKD